MLRTEDQVAPIDQPLGKAPMPANGRNGLGVFGSNKQRPFHRWYPFVEGYSADLVQRAISEQTKPGTVLDPFGGSGTTALAAAMLGRDSIYAEVNPYLAWVADVKINQSRITAASGQLDDLRAIARDLRSTRRQVEPDHPLILADEKRRYFPPDVAEQAVSLHSFFSQELAGGAREVARLALATALVPSSNMVRRTDLRKRVASDPAPANLIDAVGARLREFADDIEQYAHLINGYASQVATDTRGRWETEAKASVIITSPPYLNGTNYCRNSKLELLTLGFISSEKELASLRKSMISAGINNVSKKRTEAEPIAAVEKIASQLDLVAYDSRIPKLVRTYFSDMKSALSRVRHHSIDGARMHFDIGDSRYSGVHVPTHTLLQSVAEDVGWRFLGQDILRVRRSYDGSKLTQVLMRFEAA